MGTYTTQEFMDIFGGLPERGESAVDPDAVRDAADEYTANDVAADAAMDRDWFDDHEFDDPDLARDDDYGDRDEDDPEDDG